MIMIFDNMDEKKQNKTDFDEAHNKFRYGGRGSWDAP